MGNLFSTTTTTTKTYNNCHDIHVKSSAPIILDALATQSHEVLPNITSTHIKNIKFDHPESPFTVYFHDGSHVKIKVDDVDLENHVIKFTTLEGSILGDKFEKISSVAKLEDLGDGRTIVKLSAKYHSKDDHEPTAAEINAGNERAGEFCKAIEEHLIANPNVSA